MPMSLKTGFTTTSQSSKDTESSREERVRERKTQYPALVNPCRKNTRETLHYGNIVNLENRAGPSTREARSGQACLCRHAGLAGTLKTPPLRKKSSASST